MTWENLTADAEALREKLGFERWAVLGHSFGGMVALEYALRYPDSLSHLLLLDTCGDSRWQQQNAPEILAKRGYRPGTVKLARRFYNGQIAPWEMVPALMFRFGTAYYHRPFSLRVARELFRERRVKARGEAFVFGAGQLWKGWSVMDRLGEIKVPTLVMAGRDDFLFPPECQVELAAGIPNARLEIIERAGHNAQAERPAEVTQAVRDFLSAAVAVPAAGASLCLNGAWLPRRSRIEPAAYVNGRLSSKAAARALSDELAAAGDLGVGLPRMAGHAADHAPGPEHGQRHLVDVAHLRLFQGDRRQRRQDRLALRVRPEGVRPALLRGGGAAARRAVATRRAAAAGRRQRRVAGGAAWGRGARHAFDSTADVGRNPQPLSVELAAVITPFSGSCALGGGQGGRSPVLRFDPPYPRDRRGRGWRPAHDAPRPHTLCHL